MTEQLKEKLQQIIADEKFKLDAFFLCGAATSAPNQRLQRACEQYLAAIERGPADKEIIDTLVAELKATIDQRSRIKITGDLANNLSDIEEVYNARALL